jgi:hypothetical protein
LAARLGLSVAEPEVVEVRAELITHTEDLVIRLGRGRAPCKAGKQFGSRSPETWRMWRCTIFFRTNSCAK